MKMLERNFIKQIAEKILLELSSDLYLVDVIMSSDGKITVEVDKDNGVSVDDCIILSRRIETELSPEIENFELEVTSAGLTSPLKIPRQYKKNEGNEVEVLSKDGRKLAGILKSSDDNGFVLTITKMVKPEGAKRKIAIEEDLPFDYDDVKYTKYLIRFK